MAAKKGQANQKFAFINAIEASLFAFQLLFACNTAFYFNM